MNLVRGAWKILVAIKDGLVLIFMLLFFTALFAVLSARPNAAAGASDGALVIALDLQNMAVSTGSACSSGSIEPSHVLLAMGRNREEARSSVRFSFGRYNTVEEMKALVEVTACAAEKLRKEEKRLAG